MRSALTFRDEMAALYRRHGPRHILPFVGSAYESDESLLRVCALGINAYISPDDWPDRDSELQDWYQSWWALAGHGKTNRFFETAYHQCDILARSLACSPQLRVLAYDPNPVRKSGFYGTNAIKVFTEDTFKKAEALSPGDFDAYTPTWYAELDLMAKHNCLPHLIVVFGGAIWSYACSAFDPNQSVASSRYDHMRIEEYVAAGGRHSPSYHWANRIVARTAAGRQTVFVVRLHHPCSRALPRRDAEWLLSQFDFRHLAGLGAKLKG